MNHFERMNLRWIPGFFLAAISCLVVSTSAQAPIPPTLPIVRVTATTPETLEPLACAPGTLCPPIARPVPGVIELSRVHPDVSLPLKVRVKWGGTASPGTDYVGIEGSITIPAGSSKTEIHVEAFPDFLKEPTETVVLEVIATDADLYLVAQGKGSAEVAIRDTVPMDSTPVFSIEATQSETSEPCPTCRVIPGKFVVRRTGSLDHALEVGIQYTGTARPSADYETLPKSVRFAVHVSEVAIAVVAKMDELVEGIETVVAELEPDMSLGPIPIYRLHPNASRAQVTIRDQVVSDLPKVSIVALTPDSWEYCCCPACFCACEASTGGTFRISRIGGNLEQPLRLMLLPSGQAIAGKDYDVQRLVRIGTNNMPAVEVEIPAGRQFVDLTVAAGWDEEKEPDEKIIFSIAPASTDGVGGPYIIGQGTATMVLHDREGLVTAVVSVEAPAPETSECPPDRDCGMAPAVFAFTRVGRNLEKPLTYTLKWTGSARFKDDYSVFAEKGFAELPETVVFPARVRRVEWKVSAATDCLVEGRETVTVALGSAEGNPDPGVVKGNRSATIFIDDGLPTGPKGEALQPTVTLKLSEQIWEMCPAGANCAPGTLVVSRTGPGLDAPLVVGLEIGGTATPDVDYKALPTLVKFAGGEDTVRIPFVAVDDLKGEPNETVIVRLKCAEGKNVPYLIKATDAEKSSMIRDNDRLEQAQLALRVENGSGREPFRCGADVPCPKVLDMPAVFSIVRKGSLKGDLKVRLGTSGTATPGADYPPLPSSILLPDGKTNVLVSIFPLPDARLESTENIKVALVASEAYQVDPGAGSISLEILDRAPAVTGEIFITRPNEGLTIQAGESITFEAESYIKTGVLAELDWFAANKIGTSKLTFVREPEPGTTLTHSFVWKNPPEGIHVVKARSLKGDIQSPGVTVVVKPKPALPVVTVEASVAETREVPPGSKIVVRAAVFLLRRTGPTNQSLKVDYSVGGTASNGTDYNELDGDATIAAGSLTREILVWPKTDEKIEGDETVILTLKKRENYAVGDALSAKVVIHDGNTPETAQLKITAPTSGGTYRAPATVAIKAEGVDPKGYVAAIEFFANGKSIGSEVLSFPACVGCEPLPGTPTVFKLDWKNVPAETYTLTAVGKTSTGNRVDAAPVKITVLPENPPPFAVRDLPELFTPKEKFKVSIRLTPEPGTRSQGLEETPPTGWVVSAISDGGVWDALRKKVKFGPFQDALARTLTYEITPPVDAGNVAEFSGTVSMDGTGSRVSGDRVIRSEVLHPADRSPGNFSLSLNEVTAYAAAWKSGTNWPTGPNPIPVDYVTRAGALWRSGEAYIFDPGAGPAPLWWVTPPAKAAPASLDSGWKSAGYGVAEISETGLSIKVSPRSEVLSWALEERLPEGVVATEISDSGAFDSRHRTIRWGPFYGAARVQLRATLSGEFRQVRSGFSGNLSMDGRRQAYFHIPAKAIGLVAKKSAVPEVEAVEDGNVLVTIGGQEACPGCRIEVSDDLKTWQSLGSESEAFDDGSARIDAAAGEKKQRFYRLALPGTSSEE